MSAKAAKDGGYLPNLRVASVQKRPARRDAEAEEKADIREKERRRKQAFLRRERKRDWHLPEDPE